MDLAKNLLRTTARAFYKTEEVLIVDALAIHSTLTDVDLAYCLGTQKKELRKLCGTLKDHGIISVQSRAEKKEDAPAPPPPPPTTSSNGQQYQQRSFVKHQDWYWLHFHPAIDAIKYRLWKLSDKVEKMGKSTTEHKDLACPRCKEEYTDLEVMDNIDLDGNFLCHKCGHALDAVDPEKTKEDSESKRRLNTEVAAIAALLKEIDGTTVPENDFDNALALHLPINRGDAHPDRRNQIAEEIKPSLASSKGLTLAPEKVSVSVLDDAEQAALKPDPEALRIKREAEAKQNMLPDWISKSTISGDITAVGAKEAKERRERDAHGGGLHDDNAAVAEEKKPGDSTGDDATLDEYWELLKKEKERERVEAEEEDEDDDDDEDDFEDVEPVAAAAAAAATTSAVPEVKVEEMSASVNDGPAAKKVKIEEPTPTPAESDEDDMEFEDV